MAAGKLYVLEGADGVGKTTLANMLVTYLNDHGVLSKYFSFPGREPGTLGELVYRIHHDPTGVVGGEVTPAAIQALHIAAHLDVIERQIIPMLQSGTSVVLDRYFWSMLVYGQKNGVAQHVLRSLAVAERMAWGDFLPQPVLLLTPRSPKRQLNISHDDWREIQHGYLQLAIEESRYGVQVRQIDNTNQSPEETLAAIVSNLSL